MAFSATISDDCKTITLSGGTGGAVVTVYKNDFTTALTGTSVTLNGGGTTAVIATSLGLTADSELNGVYRFDDGTNPPVGCVGACDIDCCIAKQMDSYLQDSCGCGQCSKEIEFISKIYLLMKSSKASVRLANPEFTNAYDKYIKASTLCTQTCKCNCS